MRSKRQSFLSSPSIRRATPPRQILRTSVSRFYPRPPYGGRPAASRPPWLAPPRFYPRPPYGGRPARELRGGGAVGFLSSPSIRRATRETDGWMGGQRFLSSPSIRRATSMVICAVCAVGVSILALHTEGDGIRPPRGGRRPRFYPRPPYGGRPARRTRWLWTCSFYPRPPYGGRHRCGMMLCLSLTFLSSPSIRRATVLHAHVARRAGRFYPRPPYGGRLGQQIFYLSQRVSILALHTEGDPPPPNMALAENVFLSSPSIRRATLARGVRQQPDVGFYPRPPYGGRPKPPPTMPNAPRFLSSPSIRRATVCGWMKKVTMRCFYPRPPYGGRR